MNIQDPISTDAPAQSSDDDSSSTKSRRSDEDKAKDSKSFSKVLAEKTGKAEKGEKKKDADAPAAQAQTALPQGFRETAPVTQQAKQVSVAALPPAMQNLVQEITVAAGPQNRTQVDIQLNSKTFDGLKISIAHADGDVRIQMVSQTPEVAAVLNRNLEQLSQALTTRGVRVASIRVTRETRGQSGRQA